MSDATLLSDEYLQALRDTAKARLDRIRKAQYKEAEDIYNSLGRGVPKLLDHIESQAAEIERLRAKEQRDA